MIEALNGLWQTTDYSEAGDPNNYSAEERMKFLGEWIHVRKACGRLFGETRRLDPDFPGWDPIRKSVPVDQRLREAQ